MAYAALISLSQTLEQILQPGQQITSLQEKVGRLQAILEDSSQDGSSLPVNHLEGRIRDAAYEAEDIIESQISRPALLKYICCGVGRCFGEMISALLNMVPAFHQNMDLEFKGLEKKIDEFDSILEALSKIKDGKAQSLQPGNSLTAVSSRFVAGNEGAPVGVDKDLLQIKGRLIGPPSQLDIISIVGMGGIGKTTLARNVYNDPLVEQHFDIHAWTVVSQEYRVREMLTSLVDSTRRGSGELHEKSIEQLAVLLHKSLKGRRYLIVMDDVWNIQAWDNVKRYLPDDNIGSRIILTTRISELALYAKSYSPIHHMRLLGSQESWNLLREKIFGKERCPFGMEKIGKKIARDCKGLPLAIVVIGGLLSKASRTKDYWEYIAKNVKSAVTENADQFMEILSLSYNSLPCHLKACFLYMAVFPKDHEIFVSQLIKLWIAEGFVRPLSPKSFEAVAEEYLKDLVDRNLVLVCRRYHNGEIKTCIIHDLLRKLCIRKAQDEKFLQIMNRSVCVLPKGRNNPRRVSIHSNILDHLKDIHKSSVRSLLYFCKNRSNNQLLSFTMSCRLLRVLDAVTIKFYEFPVEIVELVNLRYLAFIYRGQLKFPASISKLRNLQTLVVYRRTFPFELNTLYLPSEIWEMPQLRHLLFQRSILPYPFPKQIIGKDSVVVLYNLQTLSGVIDFRCTKEVTEIMPNLKKLEITYVYDTHTKWSSYELNNFVYLDQLETLKCVFTSKNYFDNYPLVNLAFPRNLKNLTLSGSRIPWEKMTNVGSLPNLEVLELEVFAFEGRVWEPKEGDFSQLKFLHIETNSLEHWRAKDTHFPRLQHLSLRFCFNLVEIPSEIGEIPTLQMIELFECSPSAVASAMLIKEEQQDLENDGLRVRVNSLTKGPARFLNLPVRNKRPRRYMR